VRDFKCFVANCDRKLQQNKKKCPEMTMNRQKYVGQRLFWGYRHANEEEKGGGRERKRRPGCREIERAKHRRVTKKRVKFLPFRCGTFLKMASFGKNGAIRRMGCRGSRVTDEYSSIQGRLLDFEEALA